MEFAPASDETAIALAVATAENPVGEAAFAT